MFSRIARQHRRFLLGSLLLTAFMAAMLAQGLMEWPADAPAASPLMAVAWAITLILVIGIPLVLFAVLLPGLLPLIELWLITLLLLALMDAPLRHMLGLETLPGWASCAVLVAGFIVVERALYGPWLSRVWRRDMARKTSHFTVETSPAEAWRTLFPDPAHARDFYWPEAGFMAAPEGSDADFILSLPRRTGYKNTLSAVTIETATPEQHFRYRTTPLPGSADAAQIIEVQITPEGSGRSRITYAEQNLDVSFGVRLFFFLSHGFRDTSASLRARLEGRKDRSIQGQQMLRP